MIFDQAVELVLKHEGGYVNDPHDAGGETKYGISKRAYPHLAIKSLTEEQAKEIYKKDYFDKVKGDQLPDPVSVLVFDFAVNAGVSRSVKMLQESVGAIPDGIIGPKTLKATEEKYEACGEELLNRLAQDRLDYYRKLYTWERFGRGWTRRTIETLNFSTKIHNHQIG